LFRVSIKALIKRDDGKILAVKETGRDWWDLPGGGMDHEEDIKTALARELHEEVNLTGDFTYRVIAVEDPKQLDHAAIWQLRLVFEVIPTNMTFTAGEDGDEVEFIDPESLKSSNKYAEQKVYEYAQIA
jgi:ADP-ribose pyrophosphatase YjhB (NUDIX family)